VITVVLLAILASLDDHIAVLHNVFGVGSQHLAPLKHE